jgi:hypothetical protein
MPTGINQELEFEKRISGMPDRTLLEFVARQNWETCIRCEAHDKRIKSLETGSKSISGITGGITGAITGIIIGVINYFANRG